MELGYRKMENIPEEENYNLSSSHYIVKAIN
jgi:hypothetical protein